MDTIPNELLVHIFNNFYKYQEFAVLSQVCKKWHQIIWELQQQLFLIKFQKILQEDLLENLLQKTPKIKKIEMPPQTEDRHVEVLSNFTTIEHVSLRRCIQLTDEGLRVLEKLVNLKELCLSCSWNLTKLDFLKSMTETLEYIELRGCDMLTSETFTELQQTSERFLRVTQLDLRDCVKVEDSGVEAIVNMMPNLTLFDVAGTKITSISAQFISSLHNLATLILWGCDNIDDISLAALAKSPSLRHINLLDCCSITDAGLKSLSESKSLVTVELGGKQFTDVGLRHLARIPSLESMFVVSENSLITEAKVQDIQAKYPAISIRLTILDSDEE